MIKNTNKLVKSNAYVTLELTHSITEEIVLNSFLDLYNSFSEHNSSTGNSNNLIYVNI